MPSIALVERRKDSFRRLETTRLYKKMLGVSLKEAMEQVDFLTKTEGYEIPVADADVIAAAHFIYQAQEFGLICQLRSSFSV